MSWNFHLVLNPCGVCGREDGTAYKRNYTYNVSPMFFDAFPSTPEDRTGGIRQLDGLTGRECSELLRVAIEAMAGDPEKYRAMNPSNGWGDYDSALVMLRQMAAACEEHPDNSRMSIT